MTKAVVVTGASTGIGRETALRLLQRGYLVFAGVRKTQDANDLREAAGEGEGAERLKPVILDVTKPQTIAETMKTVQELTEGQGLWALVNNAGIAVAGPLETLPMEKFEEQFDVNVFGVLRMVQSALPLLRKAEGRIINVSSISGRIASPALGAYAASKFALEAMSDALRREIMGQGVSVSIIEPGPIKTPIWEKSKGEGDRLQENMSEEQRALYESMIDRLRQQVIEAEHNGLPASRVVDAIEHALTVERPKTRYPIGAPIQVASLLAGIVPDTIADKLMTVQMRPQDFKLSRLVKTFSRNRTRPV